MTQDAEKRIEEAYGEYQAKVENAIRFYDAKVAEIRSNIGEKTSETKASTAATEAEFKKQIVEAERGARAKTMHFNQEKFEENNVDSEAVLDVSYVSSLPLKGISACGVSSFISLSLRWTHRSIVQGK